MHAESGVVKVDTEKVIHELIANRHPCVEGDGKAPHREVIQDVIKDTQALMYPSVFHDHRGEFDLVFDLNKNLTSEIQIALSEVGVKGTEAKEKAQQVTDEFIAELPNLLVKLNKDIKAIYDGDPAATSFKEIVLCYPGYFATFCYRIAHELFIRKVPIIPRFISEFAHQKTGSDINPGAKIGEYFSIDHATGIVIGGTAVIGDHVQIYHGVTLGAKSFEKDENGVLLKGGKRHPNIGNNVVIYANATILGGDTTIGDGCVVGSNAWITKSTEPGTLCV